MCGIDGETDVIEFSDVSVNYDISGTDVSSAQGGSQLKNILFRAEQGEVLLLAGPSGSGKTTVMRLITGLIPDFYEASVTGKVLVPGRVNGLVRPDSVGIVMQNPRSQFFMNDVAGELVFTVSGLGLPKEQIMKRLAATVKVMQLESIIDRENIQKLSGGEKQKIAAAEVIIADPRIILLDEPSSSLDYSSIESLRGQIRLWKSMGKTVIVSEHRLWFLWDLADRMLLFRDGRLEKEYSRDQMNRLCDRDLEKLGLRSISTVRNDLSKVIYPQQRESDELYELSDFCFKRKDRQYRIRRIAFAKGAVTAVTAPNGTGKSTLLHCLSGILKFSAVIRDGAQIIDRKKFCRKWFMVFQDPNYQLCRETVEEELSCSFPADTPPEQISCGIRNILKELDLDGTQQRHPLSLSGGQKQRLAIGCAVASGKNMLLDEPTSGLDYANMTAMAEFLKRLSRDRGITVVVVTHDPEFIRSCCNRQIMLEYERNQL